MSVPLAADWRRVFCAALALSTVGAWAQGYRTDPGKSQLEFSGKQAGAPFKAVVKSFTAAVSFDANHLADSKIEVEMDLRSVDSQDSERDTTMRGADFFDVARFAKAHYVTRQITKSASGYSAVGSLTLRGVTREVPIQFTWKEQAPGSTASVATLTGHAQLKRLDFGVGQGEWKSTEWVGNEVEVNFSLALVADASGAKTPPAKGGR